MHCSFVRFVLGTLLLVAGWASVAWSEGGYRACIGQYPEQCGLYFNLVKLHDIFDCGTSVQQVGKSVCEAVANADPNYDGRYKTSVISNIPVNRCGYTLVYVYCYQKWCPQVPTPHQRE
jgi:hypothetical protein